MISGQVSVATHDLTRIEAALGSSPKAAYTGAHVYPHAAPMFKPDPFAVRERPVHDHMRLYAHIPFCNYGCSFCCYAKRVKAPADEKERYVNALLRELEWVPEGTPLSQLFIGGGTPTALPVELLDRVLAGIFSRMPQYGDPIHTVEASPESISDGHIEVLLKHRVGRVSMGIQSLQSGVLENISRKHGEQIAIEACARILQSDLILNIDLMYGLPGQTQDSFRRDIEIAAELGVQAFTAYNLRLNEFTPVSRSLSSDEHLNLQKLMDWRTFLMETASEFGYTQTRWHTFKRMDSNAARHERLACTDDTMRGFQLGIGMSARSHLGYTVYRNHSRIKTYMERVEQGQSPVQEIFPLLEEDRQTQYIARTIGDGKPLQRSSYQQTFGHSIDQDFPATLQKLTDCNLIIDDRQSVRLSETGKLVYDLITLAFYPPRAQKWLNERLANFAF